MIDLIFILFLCLGGLFILSIDKCGVRLVLYFLGVFLLIGFFLVFIILGRDV